MRDLVVPQGEKESHEKRARRLFDDPYEPVDDAVMQMAMLGHNGGPLLDESGDSLFGWEGNSQTWYYALSG